MGCNNSTTARSMEPQDSPPDAIVDQAREAH
jgi:hypothetical protein